MIILPFQSIHDHVDLRGDRVGAEHRCRDHRAEYDGGNKAVRFASWPGPLPERQDFIELNPTAVP
jgi:hypothetical protein